MTVVPDKICGITMQEMTIINKDHWFDVKGKGL